MSAADDGGPAFPVKDLSKWQVPGMSLRAYIALHRPAPEEFSRKFAESLIGRPMPERGGSVEAHTLELEFQRWWADASAAYSVMQADALIAALQAKPAPASVEFTLRAPVYANVVKSAEAAPRVSPQKAQQAMVDAGVRAWHAADSALLDDRVSAVWEAMAAVAPEPQSSVDIERISRVVQLWASGVEGSSIAMQDISRIIREHMASNG